MFVRFGEFEFDRDSGTLLKRGQVIDLAPRAAKLLGILLANRPRSVAKGELERQLWPDTFIADTSLPNVILDLRRALEQEGSPALIRTARGFGYGFSGEAKFDEGPPSPMGMFRLSAHGRVIGLLDGENWIGRAADCRIQADCDLASRHHACIVVEGRDATLQDGGSRNGTFLNNERLARPTRLNHRDEIRVGTIHFGFRVVHPDRPTDAEKPAVTRQVPDRSARRPAGGPGLLRFKGGADH